MRRLLPLLAVAALAGSACGADDDLAYSVEPVEVTVAGEDVTVPGVEADRAEVDEELRDIEEADEFVEFVESTGGTVRAADGSGLDSDYVAQYLSDRIVFDLLEAEFDRRGLELDDEARAAGEADLTARLAPPVDPGVPEEEQGLSGEEVLAAMPVTYRDFLVESFARVSVLQTEAASDAAPTDEEVRAAYDEDPAGFEQACGAHILIAVNEDPAAGELVDATRAEAGAQFVINQLEAGADFAEIARERSDDPGSGAQGGDLGCAPRGTYVPEFEEALFGAEPGEIVGPVNTEFGSHVVRLDELRADFEDVRDAVAQSLTGAEDPFGALVQALLEAAQVTVDERYGTWDPTQGRVVPRSGPSATTTTLPVLDAPQEAPTTTAGG